MTTPSEAVPGVPLGAQERSDAAVRGTRPFWWSVRRELWENRSVWIAPVAVAAVVLLGAAINAYGLAERTRHALQLPPESQRFRIAGPFDMAALMLVVTGLVVAVFYSLDALHGERRDRSILFWKSLPVSDVTTILSKAAIPLAVIPLLVFVLVMTVQTLMFLLGSAVLLAHGMSPSSLFVGWNPFVKAVVVAYGLGALTLWHAPIYAWFILVSGWARRAVVLWAVVPIIGLSALFRVGRASTDVCSLLVYRVIGVIDEAFVSARGGIDSLAQLTPGKFLARPALWIGLAVAAVFLAAAVRVRHNREPI
ncbi:MAG TPA: ABC transporter permease [Thermoanaerobaculia bacterium]